MHVKNTALVVLVLLAAITASSQQYKGEVSGWVSGVTHKYNGDFNSDVWGLGGMVSLQYAPISRLGIEARVGLGEYRWKTSRSDLAMHPGYYGRNGLYDYNYPGTLTAIEPENESRISTVDLLLNYVIVNHIPAVPFISAGVGMVNFAPSTSEAHDPLPNNIFGKYNTTAFSIPIGGGVRIPISYRAGIVLRGEYRFVFSKYLDDVSFNNANDGITSVSLGFSYRFTNPPRRMCACMRGGNHHEPCANSGSRHDADCPCGLQRGAMDSQDGDAGDRGPHSGSQHDNNSSSDGGGDQAGADGSENKGGTTTVPTDTTGKKQVSPSMGTEPNKPEPPIDSAANNTAEPTANVQPCPDGTIRVCIGSNKSVCVKPTAKGKDRIAWEQGLIIDESDPNNHQSLSTAGKDNPYYDRVIRQTPTAYYLCVDCSFNKLPLGNRVIYEMVDGQVVKGEGTFTPENCPDCNKLAEEGR